jgi:phosphoribosylaminoimidazolecarboxamide formyltransferase / IMP cyclohydrolase
LQSPGDGAAIEYLLKNKYSVLRFRHQSDLLSASEAVQDLIAVRTAIATVSNKTGLAELAAELAKYGVEMIATEGTAKQLMGLKVKGLSVTDLTDYTGYPENLNGRLKTLHPKIQAGVLAINGYHDPILAKKKYKFIELVIVNLYPFEQVAARNASYFECIENIDIGGPALLRAGAKNHACVTVISDPRDYSLLVEELKRNSGSTSLAFRRKCAQKVFELTSRYDRAIEAWFETQLSVLGHSHHSDKSGRDISWSRASARK